MGFFSSKKTTYDPMSAYTPEQQASIRALMSLASTGSGGGITLGEAYGGALGSYDTSGQQTAYDQLMSLYGGKELSTAGDVYTRMANNSFNPDDPSSGYAAYSRALAKAGEESSSALDREAAMTGSRFGTSIVEKKADLSADLANQRGMFLAELFNQGENRALQGAQGLQSLVGTKSGLATTASSQAAMINAINDAKAKDALDEFKRQRKETLSRIGLMQNQMNSPMGTITTTSPSSFSQLGSNVLEGAGSALGGMLVGGVGNLFSGFSSGNVSGTGLFGSKLGGSTQSEILGFDTRRFA